MDLHIRFYKGASGKQNMWIEKDDRNGARHEINSIEDAANVIIRYIKENTSLCE